MCQAIAVNPSSLRKLIISFVSISSNMAVNYILMLDELKSIHTESLDSKYAFKIVGEIKYPHRYN
jgi:hypothetical protein